LPFHFFTENKHQSILIMILTEIKFEVWNDWILNQVGVAVVAIGVLIFLYRLYVKTQEAKDNIVKRERDYLVEELNESQAETNEKDQMILAIHRDYQQQISTLHSSYQDRLKELQKDQNEVNLKTVDALGQISNLVDGALLHKISMNAQKTQEMISHLRTEILMKIEGVVKK